MNVVSAVVTVSLQDIVTVWVENGIVKTLPNVVLELSTMNAESVMVQVNQKDTVTVTVIL